MSRKFFVLFMVFVSAVVSLELPNPWVSEPISIMSAMELPPDPTLYKTMALDYWIPSGGAQILIIQAERPLRAPVDSTWSGTAVPHFMTSSRYDIDTTFCTDITGSYISEIPVNAEMGMALLRAEGEGFFAVRAMDFFGEMKSSLPILFEVVPSGTVATRWQIFGEKITSQYNNFDLHWAVASDADGLPVPSFLPGIVMDYAVAEVVYESNPNGSAGVMSPFTRIPAPYAVLPVIYGMAPFFIHNTESETVGVRAYSLMDTLTPSDTFMVYVVPASESPFLLVNRFDGMRIAQDRPSSIYAMAFNGSTPDYSNSSTKVRLHAIDLQGAESVVLEPDSWRRLTGGFAGFMLTDSEPDTLCIFIGAETDSVPELVVPFYTPIQVVPPDIALKFAFRSPNIAIVGDTMKLEIQGINGLGEIDDALDAWLILEFEDTDFSLVVIDSASGDSWTAGMAGETGLHMTEGRYVLYLVNSQPETLRFAARDAEMMGLFDQGLIGFMHEYEIRFEIADSSGAIQYRFEPAGAGVFPSMENIGLTITARTGAGLIDAGYSGSAVVVADGGAELDPPSGIVNFEGGIAIISIMKDSAGRVDLEISGPLLPTYTSLMFLDPSGGGVLFPLEYDRWQPIWEPRNVVFGVMNLEGIDVSYNGFASITIIDPNDNGSVFAPDSVEIIGGLGSFIITNGDPEAFRLIVDSGDDMVGVFEIQIESRALIEYILPCGCEVGALLDSIEFHIFDTTGTYFPYSCTLQLEIIEGNPNSSVSYDRSVYITNGRGISVIENTESETLEVYLSIPDGRYVYSDAPLVGEWEYYLGEVYYIGCNIGEAVLPKVFALGPTVPNPFNSAFALSIALPEDSDIEIEVYGIDGRLVQHRKIEKLSAGNHNITFDLGDSPSGIYWIRASADDMSLTRKAVLLK